LGGCVWLVAIHVRARSQIEAFSSAADDPAEQIQHQLRGQ